MHNKRAGAMNTGVYPNYFAGSKNKSFDVSYYNQPARLGQSFACRKCGSDYHKFAVDGFCQNCQQRVEFIVREFPATANAARNKNEKAEVRV